MPQRLKVLPETLGSIGVQEDALVSEPIGNSPNRQRCAACGGVAVRMARVLRTAGDLASIVPGATLQGAIDGQFDGYLPLCPTCLPACAECGRPRVTERVSALLDELQPSVTAGSLYVDWWIDPCDDASHTVTEDWSVS